MSIHDMINLERYPLGDTNSKPYKALVADCRRQLAQDGCCLLPAFLKQQALEQARHEAISHAETAYQMNHYFAYDDVNDDTLARNLDDLPADHPRRFRSLTKIRFIARDEIDKENPVQRIHRWSGMCAFLQDTLELPQVYINDCPLSACVFTVAEVGELQDWHFDGNDFIVTLMLEDSERGGNFEFATGLRSPGKEDDFETISRVINGQYTKINRPDIRPGTLTLFRGRYHLHRASAVQGRGRRVMAVLSYETTPGRTGSDKYLKLFYGRTLAEAKV